MWDGRPLGFSIVLFDLIILLSIPVSIVSKTVGKWDFCIQNTIFAVELEGNFSPWLIRGFP